MDAFRIGLSLFIAAIAGLIIMISGLGSGARFSTIFLRMTVGFAIVGALVWALAYLFRRYLFRRLIRVGLMEARLAREAAAADGTERRPADEEPEASADGAAPSASEESQTSVERREETDFSPLGQEVPRLQVVEEPKNQG